MIAPIIDVMAEKNSAKKYLLQIIIIYLENLQSGQYGPPSIDDLNNAGSLHGFLESLKIEED